MAVVGGEVLISIWDGIEEYIAVVETGSFTSAAEQLGASKSFVSKRVSELEVRLGVQLLKRTTRQVSMTAIGEQFYGACRDMRRSLAAASHEAAQAQQTPTGKLKISLNDTFDVNFISAVIADFACQYPGVAIEVHTGSREVDLIGEDFDVAIRYGDLVDSSLRAARIGYLSFCLCASPAYLGEFGSPKGIADLKNHACLSDLGGHWWFNSVDGAEKVRVAGRWKSNKGSANRVAAVRGLGLAQLPIAFVRGELASGSLVAVEDEWSYYDREAWAIFAPGTVPATLRLFLDFLSSRFARTQLRPWMQTSLAELDVYLSGGASSGPVRTSEPVAG